MGQSIILTKNEDYYLGAPNIDTVIFKIVADDNAQAMQLESDELDLALLDPKNAANFEGRDGFTCYDMTTLITVVFSLTLPTTIGRRTGT